MTESPTFTQFKLPVRADDLTQNSASGAQCIVL